MATVAPDEDSSLLEYAGGPAVHTLPDDESLDCGASLARYRPILLNDRSRFWNLYTKKNRWFTLVNGIPR